MRAMMIAMLAAAAVGLFSPSAVSAAPVNAAVVGETTSAGRMIHKVRYCCRRYRRRDLPHHRQPAQARQRPQRDLRLMLSQQEARKADRW